ncbi:nucleotide exchange factor GrpE [Mogibacterium sp.]|uniref:nucleotide exchange factor GrpE n=1 Tax=Mogibacterium sp. TaxID=2049035 RepID=UPI002580926F|nr:nucleotide exchange factor GrpE [Mogibacterium sp.]MBN2935032.1 nucleotide exchange factor GrpE [Mogibacterium sp.]
MSEEQKKEAQTPEDEVKKETGSAETSETPEEDNAPEAEATEEKAEEKSEEKADDGNEKYVRLMAEFQNYKKRVAKEKNDIREYATEKLVMELLPVLDNFERALAASAEDDPAGYAKGMELIFTQMVTELQKSGLAEVEAEGQDFDPTKHNAVMTEENEELESGKVSKVLQKGYALNDKVIRPSMVAVTK